MALNAHGKEGKTKHTVMGVLFLFCTPRWNWEE